MQRILRHLLPLAVLALAALGLVACGGGGGPEASSDTDVNTLLDQTFSGKKKIDSGKLDLTVKGDVSGGNSGASGPFDLRLTGPFEKQGANRLPKFDFDLTANGEGQSIKAGLESTGDKGFVSFNGTDYSVPGTVFEQFKAGFEEASKRSGKKGSNQSLTSLGIDPRKWLTNPKNAGEDTVGGTDVIKITGGVNVAKLLDDVNTALSEAGSLGLQGRQVPRKLTQEQQQQIEKAVKDVNVEIATGKDDMIMRRLAVSLSAVDPTGADGKLDLDLVVQLTDVNEGQDFPEPKDTKPLSGLLQQFGGLGALLGGASLSGSSGSGSSGGASQAKLHKYSKCLADAGQDVAKAQKCASLLTP